MLNRVHISMPNNIGVTAQRETGIAVASFGPATDRGRLLGTPAEQHAERMRRLSMGRTILDGRTQEDRDILDCFRNVSRYRKPVVSKGFPSSH